ncbi:hypothetical protein A3K63_01545 [Candidatus Micrarchaeota archaeon RBG_16_49_10]|nr:MAG: hypothetical protein A3K63_01545 [Candidatus Micrarchaeota archaeon RBG_16_49_10]
MKGPDIAKRLDLSKKEDLSIAVINLINAEEHLAFTAMKTGKEEYLKVLETVRELRKKLMSKLVRNKEGEMWCISKHLLAATMRLLESGEKCMMEGSQESGEFFKDAFDIYSLFWLLQKMGESNDAKKTGK